MFFLNLLTDDTLWWIQSFRDEHWGKHDNNETNFVMTRLLSNGAIEIVMKLVQCVTFGGQVLNEK